jgi:arylformamidase
MDLEAEYNNRARVPESGAIIAGWARDAAAFREGWAEKELSIAYGVGERERLDLFRPGPGGDWPVAVFIHGGYWQALDRSFVSHCARGLLARGVAVAVPSYDLCPGVALRAIVEQMREAVGLLHRRGAARVLAMGHSAGGHLTAMLMATDWAQRGMPADFVARGVAISGVFELWPLLGTSIGARLGLDEAEARALSPALLARPAGAALHAVVGGAESDEFRRQTREFAARWGGTAEELAGLDHFTVLEPLADPGTALVERAALLAR